MPSIREIVAKAKRHYPNSKPMRKDFVRKTIYLYQTNRHALITGGWQNGAH